MKLFEYDYRDEKPTYGAIQLQDLMKIHRQRIKFDTSAGTIILKFLPWRSYVATTRKLEEIPAYVKLREEGLILMDVDNSNEELYAHRLDIGLQLSQYIDQYSLGCFEDPQLNSLNELDAIYHALDKAERLTLENLLMTLTQDIPFKEVDFTVHNIAKAYGINIIDKETFENPAKIQMSVLASKYNQEQEDIADGLRK